MVVPPVARLVTSKPPDEWVVHSTFVRSRDVNFSVTSCPTVGSDFCRGYKKFNVIVDEETRLLDLSRPAKRRLAPQKES